MRDEGASPGAVRAVSGRLKADDSTWTMNQVIGGRDSTIYYHFEKEFNGFSGFFRDPSEADKIDLVVSQDGCDWTPLEVKLTVVPDSSTANEPQDGWGPEMVLRPVSSSHAMMRLASALLRQENTEIRQAVTAALKTATTP